MKPQQLNRHEKYLYSIKKLNEGHKLPAIAESLDMTLNSLYVLRSDMKKQSAKNGINHADIINHISLSNLKDHLKTSLKENDKYILDRLTTKKKPLQSNGLKIIEAIREMLLIKFG